jgi:cyclic pyranopterin phosphate synthase
MPEEGIPILPQKEILTYDEILMILEAVAGPVGLRGIRITGGEPLVRGGVLDLVQRLAKLGRFEDLSLTTNGILLEEMAGPLAEAGLHRVNVSLDTIRDGRFRSICRGGSLGKVFAGIEAAFAAGLEPVKVNQVVIPGLNDDETEEMARLTLDRELHVRFIEFMPVGNADLQKDRSYVSSRDLRQRLEKAFDIRPAEGPSGLGPARYFHIPGAKGTIGFISPLSQHFCSTCNRIRLTADGWIRTCLLSDKVGVDIKTPLRSGARGEDLVELFREAIRIKPASHDLAPSPNGGTYIRTMCQIGG